MLDDLLTEEELLYIDLRSLKSRVTYRSALRSHARALWSGVYDQFRFVDEMIDTIEWQLPIAWQEGAAKCGVSMSELTNDERNALRNEIGNEFGHLIALSQFILDNKRGKGKLRTIFNRVEFWSQAYERVMNRAQIMACKDAKFKWVLNPAEHCSSCLKLSGKVKRASYWRTHNIFPKSYNKLDCKQNCKCSLEKTTDPLTPGPLPSLP